jgi:hypothetical protein
MRSPGQRGETVNGTTTRIDGWVRQLTRSKGLRTRNGRFQAKELSKSGEFFASLARELLITWLKLSLLTLSEANYKPVHRADIIA